MSGKCQEKLPLRAEARRELVVVFSPRACEIAEFAPIAGGFKPFRWAGFS
jgi:hypothetical protein